MSKKFIIINTIIAKKFIALKKKEILKSQNFNLILLN